MKKKKDQEKKLGRNEGYGAVEKRGKNIYTDHERKDNYIRRRCGRENLIRKGNLGNGNPWAFFSPQSPSLSLDTDGRETPTKGTAITYLTVQDIKALRKVSQALGHSSFHSLPPSPLTLTAEER